MLVVFFVFSLLYPPPPQAAFPFFIFLILLEYALGHNYFKIAGVYRPVDSVTSMTAGLFQTLFHVLLPIPHLLSFVPYVYIRANLPVLTIDGLPGGILAMLMADFVYYWFHRAVRGGWQQHTVPFVLSRRHFHVVYARHMRSTCCGACTSHTIRRKPVCVRSLFRWPHSVILARLSPQ
jgi:hypothetical protein